MKKYKVCVYAICKNEEKFVDRWYESMKEADKIYVLDTGSDDGTVDKLRLHGIEVQVREIKPWRFDKARNISLEMVPEDTDICVCTDLDEVFLSGWRDKLEQSWDSSMNRLRYTYNWRLSGDTPVVSFLYEKIHSRKGYKWIYPVHEVLEYDGVDEKIGCNEEIVLNHYPDNLKSRGSYLGLLELSVRENPDDDRARHYLGREYMYYGRWNDAIDTLIGHLKLKRATWCDERAASMRYIGRCYKNMNRIDEARLWYLKAIDEAPYLRDALVEIAILEYIEGNYLDTIGYLTRALTIKKHNKTYINEIFSWDYTIDNLLSVSYYYLGLYDIALFYIRRAIDMDKDNQMLIDNEKLIREKIKDQS